MRVFLAFLLLGVTALRFREDPDEDDDDSKVDAQAKTEFDCTEDEVKQCKELVEMKGGCKPGIQIYKTVEGRTLECCGEFDSDDGKHHYGDTCSRQAAEKHEEQSDFCEANCNTCDAVMEREQECMEHCNPEGMLAKCANNKLKAELDGGFCNTTIRDPMQGFVCKYCKGSDRAARCAMCAGQCQESDKMDECHKECMGKGDGLACDKPTTPIQLFTCPCALSALRHGWIGVGVCVSCSIAEWEEHSKDDGMECPDEEKGMNGLAAEDAKCPAARTIWNDYADGKWDFHKHIRECTNEGVQEISEEMEQKDGDADEKKGANEKKDEKKGDDSKKKKADRAAKKAKADKDAKEKGDSDEDEDGDDKDDE